MRARLLPRVMVLAVVLLVAGCVVEPVAPPPRGLAVVPGYWAHGAWGPYWAEPHWRYVP